MSTAILHVRKINPAARMPAYQTAGAACFDLHAVGRVSVPCGQRASVPTGLAFEVPTGHVMLLFGRSGLAAKHGIRLANSVGVIDSDYRGEVIVMLHNDGEAWYDVNDGDRVAQAMILPVPYIHIVRTFSLSATERGEGGFGSTGR